MKKTITIIIGSLLILTTILLLCLNIKTGFKKRISQAPVLSNELKKISIQLINKSSMPSGISYSFKLKNGSPYLIKQNNAYLSFPIKIQKGQRSNEFKIEAKGNKLDIKPNEEVMLNVFAPKEDYEKDTSLDIEKPELEFVCYINDVNIENRYIIMAPIEFFNERQ